MDKMKILMTTMGLGLGGAETHIVELSKQLKRTGHDVIICSNGGVYTKELTSFGIRHYNAPMHQRSIPFMVKSLFKLLYVVLKEKPDIIHAHARIPAFLSSIVSFFTRIPFVTTAHFNFETGGGLRFFSRWGKKSLAVSNDLKKYLIDNYNISPENITVTVNGINTDEFSSKTDSTSLRKELGIPDEAKCIVTVSRMDFNACLAAFKLLDGAYDLYEIDKNYRIVVVGGGNALNDITAKAEEINKTLGFKFVYVTGGRTDISHFCSLAHIFVGVSRAALEAMSCKKPVVLAGNQGFLGLFTRDKLSRCIATNFTCRDYGETTAENIVAEIRNIENLSSEELKEVTEFSRETVKLRYSVVKMADDADMVYKSILYKNKIDFLICGYYGYNNAGDEALLKSIIKNIRNLKPDVKIGVLVRKNTLYRDLKHIRKFNRFNPFSILKALSQSEVMLFGGGNLIQDATSTKSLLYYISLLKLAKFYGLKTMLYANGIGPVNGRKNKKRVAAVLNEVDIITLRENKSYDILKELGVTKPDIRITSDEVFTLFKEEIDNKKYSYLNLPAKPYIVVSLRSWKTLDSEYDIKLAEYLEEMGKKYAFEVVFLVMQEQEDSETNIKIKNRITLQSRIYTGLSTEEMIYVISKSKFLVGMRLHSLIFATGSAIPSISIVYDPKVLGFINYMGINNYMPCENIDKNKLIDYSEAIINNYDDLRNKLGKASKVMTEAAIKNAHVAISLLEREE